ncbi:hypothetical protein [Rhodobacter calidifons]|uniref:Uncharacterized protein n=1 Tax=Rhodobacter calidifons TaxID=2715277 RepID=A0ABX0G689_9RHOB|nr:hypothetical protein [Rhodobacter calidifons]NHB76383.1 hypothetical protein [Rhodobacter calidifons]
MIRGLILAALLAGQGAAGTLEGRLVTFTVETWDNRDTPYLQARGRTVMVGQGVEFGLEPEGLTGGLDVVPVTVEILPGRIELSYPRGSGQFFEAAFNGYVLRFETDCALFESVAVDPAASTMPVTEVWAETGALYINVSGLDFGPDATLALDVEVADCPLS